MFDKYHKLISIYNLGQLSCSSCSNNISLFQKKKIVNWRILDCEMMKFLGSAQVKGLQQLSGLKYLQTTTALVRGFNYWYNTNKLTPHPTPNIIYGYGCRYISSIFLCINYIILMLLINDLNNERHIFKKRLISYVLSINI